MSHRRRFRPAPVAGFLLALAAASSFAAEPVSVLRQPSSDATSAPAPVRLERGTLRLTLEETVALALERNLGLRVERYSRQQANLGIQQALGIYDLGIGGSLASQSDERPAASNLDGASIQEQDQTTFGVGITQLFASGGTASARWSNGRFETNSQFALLNPSYSSGIEFSLTQPLLRGFGKEPTEFGIRVARLQSEGAEEGFRQQVIETVQRAENAYWNLVAAQSRLGVAEESLALARQLHKDNQIRVDVGTLAPLELVQSEAGIATRQEEIIRARAAIGDAEDVLRYLIDLRDDEAWKAPIVAETMAEMAPIDVDLAAALTTARTARPELAQQRLDQQARSLEAAFYRQQTKPRLDLTAAYGFNGVGGDALIVGPDGTVIGTSPGDWSDALKQVTDADFPGWSLGLEFGIPLQNRAAKARAAIADLSVEQGVVGIQRLQQVVEAEVRIAARGIETARQQIESAEVSVRLAEKNLEAERRKYENGLSTSFQILQVEEDLTSARSRRVDAVTGYRRALVEYHRAIGQLLEMAGVTLAE